MRIFLFGILIFASTLFAQHEEIMKKIASDFEAFDYPNVIRLADSLLVNSKPDTTSYIELNYYKAVAHYTMSEIDLARKSFISILQTNKDYKPDPIRTSPKIIDFFNGVKRDFLQIYIRMEREKNMLSQTMEQKLSRHDYESSLFRASLWRSIVLPGWGHLHVKQNTKGWLLSTASAISLGSLTYFAIDTDKKEEAYLNETDPVQIASAYNDYNKSYKIRNTLLTAYGLIWLYTQMDIIFNSDEYFKEYSPAFEIGNNSSSLSTYRINFRIAI